MFKPRSIRPGPVSRSVGVCALGALLLAGCATSVGSSATEEFPARPITIVVPFDAGGGTDLTARALEERARSTCGTSITVSNVTGGAGAVGMQQVASAAPDGYTIAVATSSTMLAHHYGTSQVTPDMFRGIMQYDSDPVVLSVATGSPLTSIRDLLKAAADGRFVTVATSGAGSITELAFMGMTEAAGVPRLTNVPFSGGAGAITAALGGQTDAVSATAGESFNQIESGALRPLVVMSDERLELLPDTPTLKELGIDWSTYVWRGLVGPAQLPDDRVQALNECMAKAFETAEFQEFMDNQNFNTEYKQAAEFDAFLDAEFTGYGDLVQRLGLRGDS